MSTQPDAPDDIPASDTSAHAAPGLGQLSPGAVLAGKYRIQRVVGDEGPALLLAATHVGLDSGVSIKVLKQELARDPAMVASFMAEARVRFTIHNEHVARVLDVATLEDGAPFAVLELLEGRDLRSILREEGDLPVERSVDLALQLCEALAAAHAGRIILGPLRLENIVVTDTVHGEHVKLFDLSCSEVHAGRDRSSTHKTRTTRGGANTLAYAAPEQIRASNRLDARADQWSLGCVLYELLTGISPFERASQMQTCAAIIEDEPQPLRARCPGVSAELEAALERCLRKDPSERYADIAKFALAIAPFGAHRTECAHRSVELLAAEERRSRPEHRQSNAPPQEPQETRARVRTRSAIVRVDVERRSTGESGFIPLTEADLAAADEVEPVARVAARNRRWVLLAFGALTVLSSSYLAARVWDARQARVAPVSTRNPSGESSPTVPEPQTDRRAADLDRAHGQPPTAAPLAATPDRPPSTSATTPKSLTPAPKLRRTRNASEEPDVGF